MPKSYYTVSDTDTTELDIRDNRVKLEIKDSPVKHDSSNRSQETIAIRTAEIVDASDANCEILALTSSYRFESSFDGEQKFAGKKDGHVYSRISNPTVDSFEKRLAAMEQAEAGVAFASGMAAIDAVFTAVLQPGDHVVCAGNVFGTTAILLAKFYSKWGVCIDFSDINDLESWRRLICEKTRLVFFETPSNPNLHIADIVGISEIAHSFGAKVVVDNTLATPIISRPLILGADVVVHSAAKYIDGQGRVGGGIVVGDFDICNELRGVVRSKGNCISPFNAWMLLKSIETLNIRMKAHSEKALIVAQALEKMPNITRVFYPGLESHPQHNLALKQHRNNQHSGLVSFEIQGEKQNAWLAIDALRLITNSTNIGDTKSLITHPASTTHGRLTSEQKIAFGIGDNLLRISVGLEDVNDVLNDIKQAIRKLDVR